jgi:hypothetical protein
MNYAVLFEIENRRQWKVGQKRSAVHDDFYIFPVSAVYYVKFRETPITRQLLSKKSTGWRNKTAVRQWA